MERRWCLQIQEVARALDRSLPCQSLVQTLGMRSPCQLCWRLPYQPLKGASLLDSALSASEVSFSLETALSASIWSMPTSALYRHGCLVIWGNWPTGVLVRWTSLPYTSPPPSHKAWAPPGSGGGNMSTRWSWNAIPIFLVHPCCQPRAARIHVVQWSILLDLRV